MDTQNSFSDILSSLMQNPEIMKMVSSLSAQKSPEEKDAPMDQKNDDPEKSDFSIPPELLASLPQMMSSLRGLSMPQSQAQNEVRSQKDQKDNQRRELLYALKPFLSEKRCNMIDSLLQFEGLAGVLGSFSQKQ